MRPERRAGAKVEVWRLGIVSGRLFFAFRVWRSALNLRGMMPRLCYIDVSVVVCLVDCCNPAFHSSIRAFSPWWYPKVVRLPYLRSSLVPSSPTSSPHHRKLDYIFDHQHRDLLCYAAVCISQYSWRTQRLATAAAATLPGLPAFFSRSFKAFHFGAKRDRR